MAENDESSLSAALIRDSAARDRDLASGPTRDSASHTIRLTTTSRLAASPDGDSARQALLQSSPLRNSFASTSADSSKSRQHASHDDASQSSLHSTISSASSNRSNESSINHSPPGHTLLQQLRHYSKSIQPRNSRMMQFTLCALGILTLCTILSLFALTEWGTAFTSHPYINRAQQQLTNITSAMSFNRQSAEQDSEDQMTTMNTASTEMRTL